jgi:hypothetical protein
MSLQGRNKKLRPPVDAVVPHVERPHQRAYCRLAATDDSKVNNLIDTSGHFFIPTPAVRLIVTDTLLSYVEYESRTSSRSKTICRIFGTCRSDQGFTRTLGPVPTRPPNMNFVSGSVRKLLTPQHI